LEAKDPKTKAVIQIAVTNLKKDEKLSQLLKRLSKNKKLKTQTKDYGVTANTQVKPSKGDKQPARISAIALESPQVLTLFGTVAKKHFTGFDKQLLEINQSFRHLNQAQIDAIKVPRLRIVKRTSQSFETLAQQSALDYEAVNIIRLLNRAFPKGNIAKIDELKTVTLDD
jgi:predicted Zn-dependent protease